MVAANQTREERMRSSLCAAMLLAGLALASAAPALAQDAAAAAPPASRCPAFPADPTLPDGATAPNSRAIRDADAAYQEWGLATKAVLDCRAVEVDELRPAAERYQARVAEYNAQAERARAIAASWAAEVAEYNARNSRPR
jgi:hypothetical protein